MVPCSIDIEIKQSSVLIMYEICLDRSMNADEGVITALNNQ